MQKSKKKEKKNKKKKEKTSTGKFAFKLTGTSICKDTKYTYKRFVQLLLSMMVNRRNGKCATNAQAASTIDWPHLVASLTYIDVRK